MYIYACLRGIWTRFTQLTCSDTVLVWVSDCSSVVHDVGVKHAFPFSLSTTFPPYFFPSYLSPLIFPLILCLFPIFPKTGFAASSAGPILFRCQIEIPGKSAILSQWWEKSGALRVIWKRMTQIPPLVLELTRGLQLKGRYVARVRGSFGLVHALVGCSQAFHSNSPLLCF